MNADEDELVMVMVIMMMMIILTKSIYRGGMMILGEMVLRDVGTASM